MGGKSLQGKFKGTNKLCQQCIKECKQFANVTVIKCGFTSNQKRVDTLQAQESAKTRGLNRIKAPIIEKTYVGMDKTTKDTLPLVESVKEGISNEA